MTQSLSEAFRHPSYVFLVIGFFTCGFQLAFITSHMPAYLSDMKIAPWVGGYSLALIGAFNILGSLTAGWLSSRMSKPWLLCYIYFGRALAGLLFVLVPISTTSVLIFSASMGFLWLSTVPPTSGLVALMFGTRYMAMLYGFAFFSHQVGGFLGVYLGGFVYQQTGSYTPLWWASVALAVGSALINIRFRKNRPPPCGGSSRTVNLCPNATLRVEPHCSTLCVRTRAGKRHVELQGHCHHQDRERATGCPVLLR